MRPVGLSKPSSPVSNENPGYHDPIRHHRPARTGRTLRQHAALPGRGRRAEGQVRAPRSAPGFGGHGLRTLGSLAQVQPARSPLARPGPLRPLGRTWMCAPVRSASCHGLRLAAGGTREVPPVGKPDAGPSGIRQDSRRRGHHRSPGARPGQRRRHGHRRGGPGGALQSTGPLDRGPLHLRPGQRRRPGGRDLFRGRIGGRPPAAGQAHRPLCRQPHHDRRQHGAGLHRRSHGPFRRVRLARPAGRTEQRHRRGRRRARRRPGKRRAGPP